MTIFQISEEMARSAQDTIKKRLSQVPIHIDAIKETHQGAFGNGTGLMWVQFLHFLSYYIMNKIHCEIIYVC